LLSSALSMLLVRSTKQI